jgi:hypothetical protein
MNTGVEHSNRQKIRFLSLTYLLRKPDGRKCKQPFIHVRFQVLTAASMMFRIVFWDVLPCKIIVDNYFTRQYIPEDNSEHPFFFQIPHRF